MAYQQSDLDALDAAYKSGASRVDLPGVGTVTYRSFDEYQRLRNQMVRDINASAGTKRVRRVKIYSSKDL
jgi:hypothetical protein